MTEYEERFRFEIAAIGDAIEYLEKHLNHIAKVKAVPGTDILDRESKLWVEEVNEIIENLKFGTIGGRAFEQEREYKKNETKVAEAWERWREENPQYF